MLWLRPWLVVICWYRCCCFVYVNVGGGGAGRGSQLGFAGVVDRVDWMVVGWMCMYVCKRTQRSVAVGSRIDSRAPTLVLASSRIPCVWLLRQPRPRERPNGHPLAKGAGGGAAHLNRRTGRHGRQTSTQARMDRTDLPKTPRVRGLLRWLVARDGRGGRRARQIHKTPTPPTWCCCCGRARRNWPAPVLPCLYDWIGRMSMVPTIESIGWSIGWARGRLTRRHQDFAPPPC